MVGEWVEAREEVGVNKWGGIANVDPQTAAQGAHIPQSPTVESKKQFSTMHLEYSRFATGKIAGAR
jgi:hypothetical protein